VNLRPIETHYKGYRFRSRLEARWAVFFDALGVPYEYEREGFDLGRAGWYLPDFWLPKQHCWIEIKPDRPNPAEDDKAYALAKATQQMVFVFWGPIPMPISESEFDSCNGDSAYAYFHDGGGDNLYKWCECSGCGSLGIVFDGRSNRLLCKRSPEKPAGCDLLGRHEDKGYNVGSPRLTTAYDSARGARFEYGEAGG
jgi:hypothetical protein